MLSSKELYNKIESIRLQKGLSISKLNKLAGISHSTLNSWKTRGTMPKLEILEGICVALDISIASLLYDVDVDKLSGEEIELLSLWAKLQKDQRLAILTTIKVMV